MGSKRNKKRAQRACGYSKGLVEQAEFDITSNDGNMSRAEDGTVVRAHGGDERVMERATAWLRENREERLRIGNDDRDHGKVVIEDTDIDGQLKLSHQAPLSSYNQTPRGTRTARQVLDLHADLYHGLRNATDWQKRSYMTYALEEAKLNQAWAASHLHPATTYAEIDKWFASLASDLAGATSYQVTAKMISLAQELATSQPESTAISPDELPAQWGFMWLDKPISRPAVDDGDDEPLLMHAVSWAYVPRLPVTDDAGMTRIMHGLRLRKWGYNEQPFIEPRPLFLMGQNTIPIGGNFIVSSLPELRVLHMLWILMGMEITSHERQPADRHGKKRAAALKRQDVTIVSLRRANHHSAGKPSGTPKVIDWTCTWLVRGHYRKARDGTLFGVGHDSSGAEHLNAMQTWVKPYLKGPDGAPLRANDILYKLSR